jgi:hypothetical protein
MQQARFWRRRTVGVTGSKVSELRRVAWKGGVIEWQREPGA